APGVDICSTITGYNSGTIYNCNYSGTSMSAPHVSGLTALLWSYYPYFNYAQIRQMIESYVDPMASPYNTMTKTGGRVNAWRSLSALWSPSDVKVVSTSAGYVILNWTDRATAETGFILYRKFGNGQYVQYKTLLADTQSFVDTDTITGQTYTYKLVAYNTIGVSPESNEATVLVVAPPAPSSGGGGGGCSVVASINPDNASDSTDILLVMLPIALALLIRLRRFGRIN
ncbi:MAG: S8 family serine peptidase, partial [Nitrospirae bacterium]|nr:S8 family serine peptidase [Nitrospirota bacterium]